MIYVRNIQIPTLPTKMPRRLYVYLPRDYRRSERRYPVLYMFDGHNVFYDSHATYGKSWGMKEYLEKMKLPLIVVAVECNHEGDMRLSEYAPWPLELPELKLPARGKLTMDWIVGSLKPEIDRTYRTLPDREHTMVAGSSMGGLMTLYAVIAYNKTFSKGAALSPSIWLPGDRLPALIDRHAPLQPTRVYMDCGSLEATEMNSFCANYRAGVLEGMFTAGKHLIAAKADAASIVVPGGHHCEADWEKRIPVFMDYLLGE